LLTVLVMHASHALLAIKTGLLSEALLRRKRQECLSIA